MTQVPTFPTIKKIIEEGVLYRKKVNPQYDSSFLENVLSYCEDITKNNSKSLVKKRKEPFYNFTIVMEEERIQLYSIVKPREAFWREKQYDKFGIKNYEAYSMLSNYLLRFVLEKVLLARDH